MNRRGLNLSIRKNLKLPLYRGIGNFSDREDQLNPPYPAPSGYQWVFLVYNGNRVVYNGNRVVTLMRIV